MGNQDWSNIGNNISDMVQQAIDSGDYSKLSQTIEKAVTSAVNSVAEGVAEGMNGAADGFGRRMNSAADGFSRGMISAADGVSRGMNSAADGFSRGMNSAADGVGRGMNSAADSLSRGMSSLGDSLNRAADKMAGRTKSSPQNPWRSGRQYEKKAVTYMRTKDLPDNELYSNGGATRIAGYTLTVLGGIGCFGFGIGMLVPWIVSVALDFNATIPLVVQLPFLLLSIVGVWKGTSMLGKIRRFKNYVRALGTRTCISIKELAASVGKGENAVQKDVRKMIEDGMFRQGHLDLGGKNLFVTDQGYEAYLDTQQKMEQRRTESIAQAKAKEAYKNNEALSDDVKKMIAEGQAYINRIHEINEAIKDEIVSQKLDGLETVITKIFEYVEQHPESAPETKKLMKYYLPTTIKLLESYQKLNDQPVQGPNIFKSKKEIEDTLDTLNQAFARLFDNLYQDTSMDIKSDISVLNTLLAQEGLTGEKL